MPPTPAMIAAARAAMIHALGLVADDAVLVVTDDETRACGEAFAAAARKVGCDVTVHRLAADERPLLGVPPELAALLDDRQVVINAIVGDVRELPFRLAWLRMLEGSAVIRLGHSPGITASMMTDGPLAVDYGRMRQLASGLIAAFADAAGAHITTPLGTDLVLDLRGRRLVSDLHAVPGVGVNLPCGEVYGCPVETGADGTLVVDGCWGSAGTVPSPLTFTLEAGRVVDARCDDAATLDAVTRLLDTDPGARTIAELGIGLNPGARLCDRMLEAEKAFRTAHLAFGDNQGMPGGRSRSAVHIDYLVTRPTITVLRADGSEVPVLADGDIVGGQEGGGHE
ncbi:MAG TPA: aminopeptidase [Candidatus Krumholzibacteria bacterium]|nr:aminopeptidase [Candidatus Krumholzibacteria bacterium]